MNDYRIFVDGACRAPYPGDMGAGVHCPETGFKLQATLGIGDPTQAELLALRLGLQYATTLTEVNSIRVYSDEQRIMNRMSGEWPIKVKSNQGLYEDCLKLARGLPIEFLWTPRQGNIRADHLSFMALGEVGR